MRGIGHFFVGYTGTLAGLLLSGKHKEIEHDGMVAMAGGFFAMLPDAHWVLPEPLKSEWHHGFHNSEWANICFFHRIIDTSLPKDKPIHAFPFYGFGSSSILSVAYNGEKECLTKEEFPQSLEQYC